MNSEQRIKDEIEHFAKKIESGFDPVKAFSAMLPRIIKEVENDSTKNYKEVLDAITKINPDTDSNENNEWAEAECFHKVQDLAKNAISNNKKSKVKP